jgi:hypothetical protein
MTELHPIIHPSERQEREIAAAELAAHFARQSQREDDARQWLARNAARIVARYDRRPFRDAQEKA